MGAIGDRHRVVVVGRGDHRQHRTERLLLAEQAVLGHPIHHGEAVVQVGGESRSASSAEQHRSAAPGGVVEVAVHLGRGGGVVERPHVGVGVEGIAEAHHLGGLQHLLDEPIVHRLEHDDPLGGTTHLTGVVVRPVDRGRGCGGKVGVGGDHGGTVARHLHDRALYPHGGDDLLAGFGRTGEADGIHPAVGDQCIADGAPAGDDRDQALGHSGLVERLGEFEQGE